MLLITGEVFQKKQGEFEDDAKQKVKYFQLVIVDKTDENRQLDTVTVPEEIFNQFEEDQEVEFIVKPKSIRVYAGMTFVTCDKYKFVSLNE